MPKKKTPRGRVQVGEAVAMGQVPFVPDSEAPVMYVDGVRVIGSVFGFALLLTRIELGAEFKAQMKQVGTIYMSPQHMKALLAVLQDRVADYEKSHGPVATS